ncbi:class I SAM-dependent methyltransferase [Candidatus Borrarchaeum sp.]|uniref:class I SAM-dependent methyltransferase n=1 Tax=Candidatus Borrarchaeum sp. TaxID=2846742 RepID=UPI00258012DD|nr:class I SAM-dependent methyltransferase [Candidatus Borrarchaeum sp.]
MQVKKKLRALRSVGFREAAKLILSEFLFGKGFTFFERFGIHVLPVHYSSPVPDTRELRKNLNEWYREWSFTGVDFNIDEQIKLLDSLRGYGLECNDLPHYEKVAAQGFGAGYGEVESHILHAMIRYFNSRIIIEVGSGISTFFAVNALSLNKREKELDSRMICIEPYPQLSLKKIEGDCKIEIVPKLVQHFDVDFFKILGKGDILFIDSSHIVKINSDVNYLFLEVLPNLNKGVVIHIHDIPFPYPTPNPDYFIFRRHQFWTEAALAQAFLVHNFAFRILLCSSYLHYKAPEALSSVFSIYDSKKHFPASLWLQKVL